LAGAFAAMAWQYWKQAAWIVESVPRRAQSGGMAFSLNLPGFVLEFAAHALGILALVTLGATWWWRPATLRTWYSVAGVLCLLPELALLAARCGFLGR
jgi:hypothetical protein